MPDLVYIDNEGITDPHVNLAIEEYALRRLDPRYTYVLFYVNEPSVIIGRGQNTVEEIDGRYVRERGVHVVRRLSGGGAVYHDAGNLNFSFITDTAQDRLHNFALFTEPVARVLRDLGAGAELGGRNDLVIGGRKVSGNAQFSTSRRMFSHGTLLFDSDLGAVAEALRVKPGKVQSKGVQSVRGRVGNIAEFAAREVDVPELQRRILASLFVGGEVRRYRLTPRDWAGVRRLVDERYGRWDWNVGASPPFDVQRARRFPFGEVDVRLDVRKGRVERARVHGDFLSTGSLRPLERALLGVPYDPESLGTALGGLDVGAVIPGLSAEAFLALLHPDAPAPEPIAAALAPGA